MSYAEDAAYELRGADRPELVIALHGLTADHAQPVRLLDGLDDRLGVLAPDLRGHGGTGFAGDPDDFRPMVVARDVIDLVRRLGLAPLRIRVMGISMGATVALELVRSGALPIDAAVYVRPAHGSERPAQLKVNSVIARLLRDDPGTALDRLLETPEYRAVAAVSERHAASLRGKAAAAGAARRAALLEHGAWTAFPPRTVDPRGAATLVVAAENDPLHPVVVAREWASRLPGARLEVVPAGDDATQVAAVGDRVRAFLESPGGDPA